MGKFTMKFKNYGATQTRTGDTVIRYNDAIGTLGDIVREKAYTKSRKIFMSAMSNSTSYISAVWKYGLGFHHVTGNMFSSLGIAVIGVNPKTKHITITHSAPFKRASGFHVTRDILDRRETYDLEKYADGTDVASLGKPYVGETGGAAGETGSDLRMRYVQEIRNTRYMGRSKNRMYSLYAFIAVPYASKVNVKRGEASNFFQERIMPLLVAGMKTAIADSK